MENPKAESVLEPLHPDFQHILRMFKQRYGEEEGERIFWAWVRKMGLNPDKPYTWPQEAFRWAEPLISLYHEDENAKYYRVEALFPVTSLNRRIRGWSRRVPTPSAERRRMERETHNRPNRQRGNNACEH